jgi:hypothetical protein
MWHRVDLVWTDISEERIASIFRVEKFGSEEPAWAGVCSLQPPAHSGSSFADFSTLKMEAIRSSETSIHTRSTRHHILVDGLLQDTSNTTFTTWNSAQLFQENYLISSVAVCSYTVRETLTGCRMTANEARRTMRLENSCAQRKSCISVPVYCEHMDRAKSGSHMLPEQGFVCMYCIYHRRFQIDLSPTNFIPLYKHQICVSSFPTNGLAISNLRFVVTWNYGVQYTALYETDKQCSANLP